jgi:DNA polymerase-3 subunit epsilon
VGKAINIRKRVTGHFTHHDSSSKRQAFIQKIHSVTYSECASELQAIVFESTEIRRLWPAFNQSQKRPRNKFALYQYEDNKGYIRLLLDKKKKNLPALCRFNELNEGKLLLRQLQEEFGLHEKLCHIDKSPLGNEDWTLLESPEIYNNRIKEGIHSISRKLPSFLVKEKGIHSNEYLYLLIERGCFWGMGFAPIDISFKNADELKNYLQPYADNQTIKKCIQSFIRQHPEKIIELEEV